MNKIVEEANALGISLVGWVESISSTYEGDIALIRLLTSGEKLTISPVRDEYLLRSDRMAAAILSAPLEHCVFYANDYAKSYGGWAPAPIGYGVEEPWNYDVESAPLYRVLQVSWSSDMGPGVFNEAKKTDDGWIARDHGNDWLVVPFNIYAWREIKPAPPEVKG